MFSQAALLTQCLHHTFHTIYFAILNVALLGTFIREVWLAHVVRSNMRANAGAILVLRRERGGVAVSCSLSDRPTSTSIARGRP